MLNFCQHFHSKAVDLYVVLFWVETKVKYFFVDSSSLFFVSGRITFFMSILAFPEHSVFVPIC